MDVAVSRRIVALVLPLTVAMAGRDMSMANLSARATDEWTHTYPLSAGGEVRITNTNATIQVEGVDGNTVEVRVERIAKSATEGGAKEFLPRIVIKEDSKPDRVTLETQSMRSIMIGAGFEVRNHVRAPKSAVLMVPGKAKATVSASVTNGGISVGSLDNFDVSEKSRRHLEGKRNGGGTSIELSTTKGSIRLRSRNTVEDMHTETDKPDERKDC